MVAKRRMRWALAGVILTLFLTLIRPSAAQTEVTIAFSLSQTELRVGDTVRTELLINNASQVVNVLVILEYTPAFVTVADAEPLEEGIQIEGGAFLDPGNPLLIDNVVDELFGEIVYEVELIQPVSGSGVLVAFDLIGNQFGEGYLRTLLIELETEDGRLLYPDGKEIGLRVTDSQVGIQPTATAGVTATLPAAGTASPTPAGGNGESTPSPTAAVTAAATTSSGEVSVSPSPSLLPPTPAVTAGAGYPPAESGRPGPPPPVGTQAPQSPEPTRVLEVDIVPLSTATSLAPAPAIAAVTGEAPAFALPTQPAIAGQQIGALAPAEVGQETASTAAGVATPPPPPPFLLPAFLASLLLFMAAGGYAVWRILRATYSS